MRAIVLLIILSFAGTSFAKDPLESLNSVEDTLKTMERTLEVQAWHDGDETIAGKGAGAGALMEGDDEREPYFVSEEPLDHNGWVRVKPCDVEGLLSLSGSDGEDCISLAEQASTGESYIWKSRAALPSDLKSGVMVLAQDKAKDGAWYLATVTDASELATGYLVISAPFRAQLKGLRVVEQ